DPVAVVVLAVRHLLPPRMHRGIGVVAVASVAGGVSILVEVEGLVDPPVAVVVDAVAFLDGTRGDIRVVVVAVPLGGAHTAPLGVPRALRRLAATSQEREREAEQEERPPI